MTRRERDLRRLARAHGCLLERTNSDHWRFCHPTGAVVIASFSPSDRGNLRVVEGCLRRIARRAERD
jgi:hypothetical protein